MLSRDHRRRVYAAAVTASVVATITDGDGLHEDRDNDDDDDRDRDRDDINAYKSPRVRAGSYVYAFCSTGWYEKRVVATTRTRAGGGALPADTDLLRLRGAVTRFSRPDNVLYRPVGEEGTTTQRFEPSSPRGLCLGVHRYGPVGKKIFDAEQRRRRQ